MKKTNFAFIILTVLMIAAVPAFGQFATTTISPATQSVEAGSSFSVDIKWSVAYNSDPSVGMQAWLNFDPSVLQVVSVASAGAPFSNEAINTYDNTAGTINYKATGSPVNSGNYTIATVVFQAISAGTSQIAFNNVIQQFQNYGPYGVNGQASGASVEVTAAVCTPTEQTFTILGANGNIGDIDPYSQSLPAGATEWQPVYLTGWHPWGFIPGTNSWVNFDPNDEVGLNTRTPYRIRFEVPEDFSNPSMTFNLKADNRAIIWINDTYIDSVDGQGSPSVDVTVAEQALHPGLNEIRLTMVDWGGIVGFNYRIDVTMTSCEDITDAVLTPDEAAALNQAPLADAGPDQNSETSSVTLDGSASSDPDGNLLSYSWSEGGNVIATGANPTVTLADGSHTITSTVSDGELSDTDEMTVVVTTNEPPVAAAGADQSIDCVIGSTAVTLDASASSDPDGDALSYSWSYAGNQVSTDASFNYTLGAGDHTFTLTVSDGEATSSDDVVIHVAIDDEAPALTLAGDNPFSLGLYTAFDDPGYSVDDACDSDPAVTLTSDLNVNIPGSYTVTYTVEDAAGNSSSVERTVEVINTAPEVAAAPTDIVLSYGDDILSSSIDLSSVFADADTNDILTYSYSNGDAGVVSAELTGSILAFDAVDLGETAVTITAVDPWGATVSTNFTVTVNVTENLAGSLLFAYSEIKIKKDTQINSGNLIVNEGSLGDSHDDEDDDHGDDDHCEDNGHGHDNDRGHGNDRGHDDDRDSHQEYQIKLEKDVMMAANYFLMADGIQIQRDAQIASDVYANTLDNRGDITGEIFGDVQTPVFTTLPPFKSAPAGTEDISVNRNQEIVIEPGDYDRIYVKDRGTITFTGGIYNIGKLEAKRSARIRFEDATEVRVADDVKISKQSYVGPAEGSFIDASSIIFYVAGDDHHAFKIEEDVNFFGTIYAQTGGVEVEKEVSFTGAILADEIHIDKDAEMWLNSFFGSSGAGLAKGLQTAWTEPEVEFDAPEQFELTSNYPNPFNPSTTISYALKEAGPVSLKIYDIRGAEVTELVNGYQESGHYSVHFSPQNISSGTYLYVLEAGSFREVKRMVYLK